MLILGTILSRPTYPPQTLGQNITRGTSPLSFWRPAWDTLMGVETPWGVKHEGDIQQLSYQGWVECTPSNYTVKQNP